jgi:hypothetical protein
MISARGLIVGGAIYVSLLTLLIYFQSRLILERLRLHAERWSPKSDPFNAFAFAFFLVIEFCLVVPVSGFIRSPLWGCFAIVGALLALLGISSLWALASLRPSDLK